MVPAQTFEALDTLASMVASAPLLATGLHAALRRPSGPDHVGHGARDGWSRPAEGSLRHL